MSAASERREAFMAATGIQVPKGALFHGTSNESAEAIMREGFRTDAGSRHRDEGAPPAVYLHHDPLVAAQHGPAVVVARRGGGPLANWGDMSHATIMGSHSSRRIPGVPMEGRQEKYLEDYGHPGYKDPDDGATIITSPGVLKPFATSHSGQCPSCFGQGHHPRTWDSCSTCSGKGVMW